MEDIYLTKEGLEKIKEQIEKLKTVDRLEVAKMIGEAKSFGDLSENSEYDAAKLKESQLEAKILELENRVKNAKIIDKNSIDTSIIGVGCTVKLYDEEFEEEIEYKIMGESESDPAQGLISNQSPVGKALIGAKVGDRITVQTPGGNCVFKVLKISVL